MHHPRRALLGPALSSAAVAVFGGADTTAAAAARESLRRAQTSAPRPGARRDHSLTADPERGVLYLFGGRANGRALADLWLYDPPTETWVHVSGDRPGPEARFGHAAAYDPASRHLIVALGQAGSNFFDDVWAFRSDAATWVRLDEQSPERPAPRYGLAAAFDAGGRRHLISHGFTSRGRFDDTWVFDVTASSWTRVTTLGAAPLKRCLARGARSMTRAAGCCSSAGSRTQTHFSPISGRSISRRACGLR